MIKALVNYIKLCRIFFALSRSGVLLYLTKLNIKPSIVFMITVINRLFGTKNPDLATSLQNLDPFFIKFGQFLSSRPDIVGSTLANNLSKLQDKLPPFSFLVSKDIIEKEFESKLEDLFASFDETPVAAASVAQVHKATTKTGKIVAVKILRPNIEKELKKTIDLFHWMAQKITACNKTYERLNLGGIIRIFEQTLFTEMDLRMEASAASELRDNLCNSQETYIPEILWDLTSKNVFTMEWVNGIPIYEIDKIQAAGINMKKVASNLAVSFFNQAYRDGFFHADMHPGNIFVGMDGKIILVDFGITSRLDKKSRIFVVETLYALINRDYKKLARINFEQGYVPDNKSEALFAQACRAVGEQIVGHPVHKISIAKLLEQLFEISNRFNMPLQTHFILLQKSMLLVEGIGMTLDPDVNMWQLAEPWIKEWALDNISIEAKLLDRAKIIFEKLLSQLD